MRTRRKRFRLRKGIIADVIFHRGCDFNISIDGVRSIYGAFVVVAILNDFVYPIRSWVDCRYTCRGVNFNGRVFDVTFCYDVTSSKDKFKVIFASEYGRECFRVVFSDIW